MKRRINKPAFAVLFGTIFIFSFAIFHHHHSNAEPIKSTSVSVTSQGNNIMQSLPDNSDTTTVTSAAQIPDNPDEPTYIDDVLIVNKTYSLPQTFNPGKLTDEVTTAFNKMQNDALLQGLSLWVASGFRSYQDQEKLYNRYVSEDGQEEADTYSSRPGHSEHQTGLAFDLNSVEDSFADTPEGIWVADNCYKYGFIIRFPKGKEKITGYQYEPWHLRYVGFEKAKEIYDRGICLEEYLNIKSEYAETEREMPENTDSEYEVPEDTDSEYKNSQYNDYEYQTPENTDSEYETSGYKDYNYTESDD